MKKMFLLCVFMMAVSVGLVVNLIDSIGVTITWSGVLAHIFIYAGAQATIITSIATLIPEAWIERFLLKFML